MKTLPTALTAVLLAVLAGCSFPVPPASSTSSVNASASSVNASASPSASPSCTLKTSFDYIVRDSQPGNVTAEKIGNVNLATCASSLSGFIASAGKASGECTTIAKAADNPGYKVNVINPAPLKKVIASAGPGC